MNPPPEKLLNNSRFYFLSASVLLSFIIFFGLVIIIPDSRLRGIRLQEIYGLLGLLYWYAVLLMSAIFKVMPKKDWVPKVIFLRRPLGVMVAYFAFLHALITIIDQLQGWHGIALLPVQFKVSLLFGTLALLVLLVMAALSVDKIVKVIGFKQWKRLGQISYVAGFITLIHIWIVGSHVPVTILQLTVFEGLVLLFGLEAWRYGKTLVANKKSKKYAIIVSIIVWAVLVLVLVNIKLFVPSYSKTHEGHIPEAGTEIHAH